ncbi:MAG: vWA domain-containing protein [bacterium]
MKKGLSEVVCIVDASGSMYMIRDDAIGGFNSFLEEQKKDPGETRLTYIQFNDRYNVIIENEDIQNVKPIDEKTYNPSSTTALLDAVGKTIEDVGNRLSNTPEDKRPENVIISILTDGQENASKKFTLEQVNKMINHQKEKYNWNFIFLAANQDAFSEGTKLGINQNDIFQYAATSVGINDAYRKMTHSVTSYKSTS